MQKKTYPLIRFIYQHNKTNLLIFIPTCIIITFYVFLLIPLEYTAQVSILPSAASFAQGFSANLGNISKIAGFDLTGTSAQSQEMYMGIILSRRLLEPVIEKTYPIRAENDTVKQNLVEFFEIDDEDEREVIEKALKKMREDVVQINIDAQNDILYLDVTTEDPFLSADIANRIISSLDIIVKTEVQKEFYQKLQYLQDRLYQIEDSLRIFEKEFRIFLETNQDPTLPSFQIQQLRMERNIRMQTELLIEFRKQLEIFIADNSINLADVKVLDKAYPPYRKSRPKRALLVIAFVGLVVFVQMGVNASVLIYNNFKRDIIETSFGSD